LKITMALPTPILGFDANGKEIVRITIGEQKTAGIWHEELKNFIKLDALYKDVRIDMDAGDVTLRLPEILIRYDLEGDEVGRYSGPTFLQASNITLNTKEKNVSGLIKNITLSTHMDRISASALSALQETSVANFTKNMNMADGMETRLTINGVNLSSAGQ